MKIISMSELRKNIYAATRELPVEVQAKGKTLFYIAATPDEVTTVSTVPMVPTLTQEEQIKLTVKMVLEEFKFPSLKVMGDLNSIPVKTSTIPVETDKVKTITGRYEVTATTLSMWCQGHFEQGVSHVCYKVSYEDENGNELLKDKWLCEKCIRGYMDKVGKVYGHIE